MHGRWRLIPRLTIPAVTVAMAAVLSGCSSGNSVNYLLEQEKVHFRNSMAKSIGATPGEMKRAFETSPEAERRHAEELTQMWVKKLGRSKDKAMQAELQSVVDRLDRMGHACVAAKPHGGGQAIFIDHDAGTLTGASDPRKDGMALGW